MVWYHAHSSEHAQLGGHNAEKPQAAMVAGVNEDNTINLMVLTQQGAPYALQSVVLIPMFWLLRICVG